ncbi:MAG: diguanylate cyclase [Coriobacteriia bacterium]|nr:diguanylate cyclase [Coriobacteriia bacterium]
MTETINTPPGGTESDLPEAVSIDEHPLRLAPDIGARLSPAEQATFFCTLVDSAFDAIIAHRPDGTIIWANQGASELLGYDTQEIMALPPYGWVAPRQLRAAPRRIETLLVEGHLMFDSAVRRKDGSLVDTEVSSRRVDTALGPVLIAVIRDISEWVESKRALEHLAYHDGLTGLSNRIFFDERLAAAIADSQRFGDILGLAYLDLDHFKPVNDRYGHDVGDAVLIEVGRRLAEETRSQDVVARIGGDEFVMVLRRMTGYDELEKVAQRLVARVEAPINALGHEISIAASVGLARFNPLTDDARSLLVKADVAMYAAKSDPAHPWLLYHEGMVVPEGRLDT